MKAFAYTSCTKLPCGQGSTVIVCTAATDFLVNDRLTFEATIASITPTCADTCRYILSYDETVLADPDSGITQDDVSGIICKDACLVKWITDLIEGGSVMVLPQVVLTAADLAADYVTYANTELLDSTKKLNYVRVLNQSDADVDISLDGGDTTAFTVLAYTSYDRDLNSFVADAQSDVQLKVSDGFTASIGNVFIEGSYQ